MERPGWLSVDTGESVIWTGRPVRLTVLGTVGSGVVWSGLVLGFAYAFVQYLPPLLERSEIAPARYVWAVAGVLVGLWALWIPVTLARTLATEYVLTDRHVYEKSGIFSVSVTRVAVEDVGNTTVRQGPLGGLLGYGTVYVDAGGQRTDLTLDGLRAPDAFHETFREISHGDDGSRTRDAPDPIDGMDGESAVQ